MQRAVSNLLGLSGRKTGGELERFNASPTAGTFCIHALVLAVLSLLCAASVRAEGPVLTLAMVDYDSLASRQSSTVKDNFVAKAARALASTESQPADLLSFLAEEIVLPTTAFLERQPEPPLGNPLLVSLRNVREDGHSKVWASLTAGYGKIFLYNSVTIYGRNGSCWEEPGFGFLKFSFNF